MNFSDKLITAIREKGNPICVGLDPRLPLIPNFIKDKYKEQHGSTKKAASFSILEFNQGTIDAICDLVPVVKPQIAFYEQYGSEGYDAYIKTVEYAREKGLVVVADAKRSDIGSTVEAYSGAFLGKIDMFGEQETGMGSDAITASAYLGWDGIKPFINDCKEFGRGIFILVKTSNPSSGEIQDLECDGMEIYKKMAELVDKWGKDVIGENGYSSVGAVVGATFPEEAAVLRKLMPKAYFLVPGYGAQGGGAEDVKPCFNADGLGAIVNSSRGITFAYQKDDKYSEENYADAARDAVLRMQEDLKTIAN